MEEKKDWIEEKIENGEAGVVFYQTIDQHIDILKDSIEQLEDAKQKGSTKVLVASWNEGQLGRMAMLILSKEGVESFDKLYKKIVS